MKTGCTRDARSAGPGPRQPERVPLKWGSVSKYTPEKAALSIEMIVPQWLLSAIQKPADCSLFEPLVLSFIRCCAIGPPLRETSYATQCQELRQLNVLPERVISPASKARERSRSTEAIVERAQRRHRRSWRSPKGQRFLGDPRLGPPISEKQGDSRTQDCHGRKRSARPSKKCQTRTKGPRRNNLVTRNPSARHLGPRLRHEFLDVALLRLRIRSVVATQSTAHLGAICPSYSCAHP